MRGPRRVTHVIGMIIIIDTLGRKKIYESEQRKQ